MDYLNNIKQLYKQISINGLQSTILSKMKKSQSIIEIAPKVEPINKLIKNNPYSIELIVNNYMIRLLESYKTEEQENYDKVLSLINELRTKTDINANDKVKLNLANNIIYEISSNISKLDARIHESNIERNILNDLIKEHIQLNKPKYNLIFKKK